MPHVCVVIPNWDGIDFIESCLKSLKVQTNPVKIIVVDNGSSDGSPEYIERNYPEILLIKLPTNRGFAGGVNVGIEKALSMHADYVLLFNNDAIANKTWVEKLVSAAEQHKECGIITSKFMRMDKKHLDSTGDFYSIWGLPFPRGRNEKDEGQYDKNIDVFGATGGASLYRAEMLKQIGLFDEDFFAYFEDVDISFRAQLAGWKVRYEPSAIAYHHVSGTSSRLGDFARFHSAKNFLLVYAKNMPLKLYLKYGPLFTLQLLRMALSSLLRGKFTVFLKGTWAAIKLHTSTKAKRKKIQASRKVSVTYIDSMLYHHRPPKPPELKIESK